MRIAFGIVVLSVVYVMAGRLGLMMDPVSGFATLVWPPAGIALAALLLFGFALWPGIAAGALLVNLLAGASLLAATGIALGNTLEGLVIANGLRTLTGFTPSLTRVKDVLALTVIAASGSAIAATIGAGVLLLSGVTEPAGFGETWRAWWFGDTMGILIIAPLILVWWTHGSARVERARIAEAVVLIVAIVALAALIFNARNPVGLRPYPYMLSPFLIWAGVRFHQRGATVAILLVAVIAIRGTAAGLGPYTNAELNDRLWALQIFMAIVTLTFLVLGAATEERKHAEEELLKAKDNAETANRAKSQFLAVISHELRTPLTGILGYASLLEDQIVGPVNNVQRMQLARIKSAALHLVSIIDGILTFSRAEAGRDEVRTEEVDAVALAREAVALVEADATSRNLTIVLQHDNHTMPLDTDPGKLRQILLNLVGNAVKFSDAGSIEVCVARDADWVVFHVRDHGPGIPEHELERIFEPFTQVDQTSTRVKGGTGLGLAVVHRLTRLLDGTITVTSEAGRGSTFTLRLPARQPQERHPQAS